MVLGLTTVDDFTHNRLNYAYLIFIFLFANKEVMKKKRGESNLLTDGMRWAAVMSGQQPNCRPGVQADSLPYDIFAALV